MRNELGNIFKALVFSAAVNALIGISVAYLFNETHTQFESMLAQNEASTLIAKTNSP